MSASERIKSRSSAISVSRAVLEPRVVRHDEDFREESIDRRPEPGDLRQSALR